MEVNMANTVDRKASSIDEFCAAHGISRAMFYKLLKQGNGPRLMNVGTLKLVSDESAAEWRRQMEAA
jgi:predicted DNA-binding transcriptional regulator AlpA